MKPGKKNKLGRGNTSDSFILGIVEPCLFPGDPSIVPVNVRLRPSVTPGAAQKVSSKGHLHTCTARAEQKECNRQGYVEEDFF